MRERTLKLRKTEEQLAAELDAMTRLHRLALLSVSEDSLEPVLGEVVDVAIAVSGADFGTIQLLDAKSSDLRIVAHRGFPQWWLDFWQTVSKGQGSCGVALERGERVIVEDVEQSPIFIGRPSLEIQLKAGVRALQSTPLVSRSGRLLGMFSTHYKKPHRPDERALRLLDLLARQAADIIEQIEAKVALRESEERFRALVTASSYAVFRMSPDWAEMRALDGQGIISDARPPSDGWLETYIHSDDQAHVMEVVRKAIRTKSMFELEHRVRRVDGSLGWVLSRAVPLLDANGEITEWFGAVSDVTARKQAEAESQAIMDATPAAIFIARDPECREMIGNRMAYELTQLPRESNVSKSAPEGHRPDTLRILKEGIEIPPQELPMQKAAATGQAIYNYEFDLLFGDGERRSVIGNAVPLLSGGGGTRGAVGAFLDITGRKRAEEQLAQQARLKDEFLALLGHELRNPLAAISSAMQSISGGVTAAERASLEELMGRQVTLMRRLVDDLLDVSRITHGQIRLQKEPIDLADLLRVAAAAAQPAVMERAQEMVVRPPAEPVRFLADQVRLKQIAANLLDNASKYTGRGGRIELSGIREGSEVVIRCRDNGRGIPPDMQQRIFEPFSRDEAAGQSDQAGLGIGLALVKRLAELHGGTVSVESRGLGAGSEFTVRLPWVEAPSVPPAAAEAAPPTRPRRALSIVLVEDNPDVVRTQALALERAGHQVTVFADGPTALSGVKGLKPDAVLLDIALPGMDGFAVAARMKRKTNMRSALFIGISGFQRRLRGGNDFDHYFVKPVDPAKLLSVIETHARAGAADARIARQATNGRNPLRVLLVEDNADLAAATEGLLRREGLEVRIALSGQEALEAAPDFQPTLALCDLHLPDMKAGDVVRGLRSNPATRHTRAVVLTALSEAEIRAFNRGAKEMGVDEFISKPLTSDTLRGLLAKLRPSQRVSGK